MCIALIGGMDRLERRYFLGARREAVGGGRGEVEKHPCAHAPLLRGLHSAPLSGLH